jgi:hypothetical protein
MVSAIPGVSANETVPLLRSRLQPSHHATKPDLRFVLGARTR